MSPASTPGTAGVRRLAVRAALAVALLTTSLAVSSAATAPAHAAAACGASNVSVYGVLPDGRLTYSSIDPDNGNLVKVQVAAAPLGFTPQAIATLNFNTVLVTSTAGALYRVDVISNNTALTHQPPVQIISRGWTHDQLTYDGHGHLYGIADGLLIRYLVSQPKPAGTAHIGQRTEIGHGFTLRTLAASGDDQLIATAADGRLLAYTISAAGTWHSALLDNAGWAGFTHLLSPGGGLYYGRTGEGAMYWYEDDNPTDGLGYDISYHLNDPVTSRGWTQRLLSAQPAVCTSTAGNPLRGRIAAIAQAEAGTPENQCDRYHTACNGGALAWCAMFATWAWERAGVADVPRGEFVARALGLWGQSRGLFKPRPSGGMGSPKPGDWVIYGTPADETGGHVDVVVQVSPTRIVVVGGNVGDRVTLREIDPRTARSGVGGNQLISGYVSPPGA